MVVRDTLGVHLIAARISMSKCRAKGQLLPVVSLLSWLLCCAEQGFVFLLSLDEGFLEQVGIFHRISRERVQKGVRNVLSLLANLIARVWASGSPSLTSAAAFHTQLRSLPTFGESFMSGTTGQ